MGKVHILGIRHHGVGSARYVAARLAQLQPDCILVEAPPELDGVLQWVGAKGLTPPVAALCYDEANPQVAGFYPFAEFSPEWQAILYANVHKIPVRSLDLPIATAWEIKKQAAIEADTEPNDAQSATENSQNTLKNSEDTGGGASEAIMIASGNPIDYFAQIAGYEDSDLWWEHTFEQHFLPHEAEAHFEAVMLMMRTLREADVRSSLDNENVAREAYMSFLIEQAKQQYYENIVVVCGAWHAPALSDQSVERSRTVSKILKTLPKTKIKVGVTWIPWTNDRLGFASGYGAGIVSPGFSAHQWKNPHDLGEIWLTKVAKTFRNKKIDVSTAHVIEAYRLARSLAGLRNLPKAGLAELNEATQSVMCMGEATLMRFVREELTVGQRIGKVPNELPKVPLQANFELKTKQLKLALTAENKELTLDLRKENDLKRSILFHQLTVLKINWATIGSARTKGTFKEVWNMAWKPEMLINLIEKAPYGNTVDTAASSFLMEKAQQIDRIAELAELMDAAIPAELFGAIEGILNKINEISTVAADTMDLMQTLIPLVEMQRYGNVRKTDLAQIEQLVDGFALRISVSLPTAAYGLDEVASFKMFDLIKRVNDAIRLTESSILIDQWFEALVKMLENVGIHGVIRGNVTRILSDAKKIENPEVEKIFSRALSKGSPPNDAAAWVEGFLRGSAMILLYDEPLWNLLYAWLETLEKEQFVELLPILRRTFSKYEPAERRQLGEKAKRGLNQNNVETVVESDLLNHQTAQNMLDAVANLLF